MPNLDQAAREQLNMRRTGLWNAAEYWRPTWQDIQRYIVPWMGRSLGGQSSVEWNNGRERGWDIYNETASDSIEVLAAGMMGGLSSPSRPWKILQVRGDPELSSFYPVRMWLDDLNLRMDSVFNSSNVYLGLHTTYKELSSFATAAMGTFEDDITTIHTRPYTCGEFWLATDGRGRVNTFWRECFMTVGEIVQEFGIEDVSELTRVQFEKGNLEMRVPVTWVVEQNDNRYQLAAARRYPWRSIHYEWAVPATTGGLNGTNNQQGPQHVLRVGGFRDFPVMTPRWDITSNDVYGTGPCFTHLPAIRQLQEMEKTGLKALKRMVMPPTKGFGITKDDIDMSEDGFTEVDNPEAQITPLFTVNYNEQANEAKIQRLEMSIRKGLFADLFMMISNTPIRSEKETAAAIAAKQQEKMMVLGPMIERVHPELLDKLIRRTYGIMLDRGMIPPPPKEIQGRMLEVQYVSMLAQAMKMAGLASLERFTSYVGAVAQYDQSVLDKVDADKLIEEYHYEIGAPERVLRPPELVAQVRLQRQQAQARQQQTEQALTMAKAAKQAGNTPVGQGGTALDEIINAARGAQA